MKKVLILTSAILFVPALVLADAVLPDYKKEAWLVSEYLCDNGSTIVNLYNSNDYGVDVYKTKSGATFYTLLLPGPDRYFIKESESSKMAEMAHKDWDAKLKEAGPNIFNAIHGNDQSDCKKSE